LFFFGSFPTAFSSAFTPMTWAIFPAAVPMDFAAFFRTFDSRLVSSDMCIPYK